MLNQKSNISTTILKKNSLNSLNNQIKDKNYRPSRYVSDEIIEKVSNNNIFQTIESNIKDNNNRGGCKNYQYIGDKYHDKKVNKKINKDGKKQIYQFKSKPFKRQASDMQIFKTIFLDPHKQLLNEVQQRGKGEQIVIAKQFCRDYEKLLNFENGQIIEQKQLIEQIQQGQVNKHYQECIQILLEQNNQKYNKKEQDFYEQQIRIQPPDLPNSSIASTISPGLGYAPSIPLTINKNKLGNLNELLMRAKASMNTDDIQKQAHLLFYIGMIYQQNNKYTLALKFYRKYLGYAKTLQDKIGICLGCNRLGINYYYCQNINKSIIYHNQNLKLSDNQNCFAGYYNLGICYRIINKFNQSLEYFYIALQWSYQNNQIQSQCISQGQLAITYKIMQLYQQSLQHFYKSLQLCRKLKKTKLQLNNLINILLITSKYKLSSQNILLEITKQAYQCSNKLQNYSKEYISCCLGIIQGSGLFKLYLQTTKFQEDIEELQMQNQ